MNICHGSPRKYLVLVTFDMTFDLDSYLYAFTDDIRKDIWLNSSFAVDYN